MYWKKLQEFQKYKVSEILEGRSEDILTWIHGADYGRSAFNDDPTKLANTDAMKLQNRFKKQPGYALFQDKLYFIQFGFIKPIVTPLQFKDTASEATLHAIKSSFPAETDDLAICSAEDIASIQSVLEPLPDKITESFGFNTRVLSPYFQDKAPTGLPFVEFSDIGFITAPETITRKNDLLPFLQNILNRVPPYDTDEDYRGLPLVIKYRNHFYLYGNTSGNEWKLTKLQSSLFQNHTFTSELTTLKYHPQHYLIYQEIIAKKGHIFFSSQAQQVLQIKKILNSVHYFKLLIQGVEQLDISFNGLFNIWTTVSDYISGDTYDKLYRGVNLITDVEVNYAQRFQEEISEFKILLERFKRYSGYDQTPGPIAQGESPPPVENTYHPSLGFQTGSTAGFVARYIYDPNGQWDIDVLSQLSADLPTHIDWLTTQLNAQTSTVTQYAPNINAAQLRALQKEATQLLKILKNTKRNSQRSQNNPLNPVYQVYQIVNYVFLIGQIVNILGATLTQVGQLNDASQELVRTYLYILKYELYPLLVKHTDRIEIEFILDPETLAVSRPLLRHLTYFHDFVTQHIKSLANFSFRGEELLVVEDSRFQAIREKNIREMSQESQAAQEQVHWARLAAVQFFENLDNNRLDLRGYYAQFAPYMQQINPDLHQQISTVLNHPNSDFGYLIPRMAAIRTQVFAHLSKLHNTEAMREEQCMAILAVLPQHSNLQLFAYNERMGCDIVLKIIDNTPLKRLKLPIDRPVLIQHHKHGKKSYSFWGNTDGTNWAMTPIEEQFIDRGILRHFNTMRQDMLSPNATPAHLVIYNLSYRAKYQSLYQQMIIKKAHTHYRSQYNSLESEVFAENKETLTHLLFQPIDWAETYFRQEPHNPNQTIADTDNIAEVAARAPTTLTTVNQHVDRYSNLQELSSKQALKLYYWYQEKIHAYRTARESLQSLQRLINEQFLPEDLIKFTKKSAVQKQCLYLYHQVRPYLIGMINFPTFDQQMVNSLTVNAAPNPERKGIICDEFNYKLERYSLDNAQELVDTWEDRAAELLNHARIRYQQEQTQALTTRRASITQDPRAQFLLKTTDLSKKIHEFHESLRQWSLILNRKIQSELRLSFKLDNPTHEDLTQLKISLRGADFPKIAQVSLNNYQNTLFNVADMIKIERALQELTQSKKMLAKFVLETHTANLPYPDIIDLRNQLGHHSFVLLLKRIFNMAYHLEQLALGLEKIRVGDSDEIKNETIDLLKQLVMEHGPALHDLGLELNHDPVIASICNDLKQQYTVIMQNLFDFIQPHTTPVTQVHPREQKVTYPGLWYVMNSFYVIPQHLLAITGQRNTNLGYGIKVITDTHTTVQTPAVRTLSLIIHDNQYYMYSNGTGDNWAVRPIPHDIIASVEIDFTQNYLEYNHRLQPLYDYLIQNQYHLSALNELQISAKRATQNIEHIIKNSNRYLRLFLSCPMIYRLNQDLQKQLQIFTRTTQEVAMSHLEIIQTDYFAPMLVAADDMEHKWGLADGEIAEPLQAMITEWYQGLIFQVKLDSFSARENLVVNNNLLFARILAEEKRHASLLEVDETQTLLMTNLDTFIQNMNTYSTYLHSWFGTYSGPALEILNQHYQPILQKLIEHHQSFIPVWVKEIPLTLDLAHLATIKTQVSTYYNQLSGTFLLHNTAQKELCNQLQTFLAQLNQIPLTNNQTTGQIPEELAEQYLRHIRPAIDKHQVSYVPQWMVSIRHTVENNYDNVDEILQQCTIYAAYLNGLLSTRQLNQALSAEKLRYLWQKMGVDALIIDAEEPNFNALIDPGADESIPLDSSNLLAFRPRLAQCQTGMTRHHLRQQQEYRLSYAKHYFYTHLNRLPYQASGLAHNKIHREYHDALRSYLLRYQNEIIRNVEHQHDADTYLTPQIQEKIAEFKLQYFDRYLRFDRVQTACNEFRRYITGDRRIPKTLCDDKLACLDLIDDVLKQPYTEGDLDTYLNRRSLLLQQSITSSEEKLLEKHPQMGNLWDWLVDCLINLFSAIGLYTPERQRRYANLVSANSPQQNLPRTWLNYATFRSTPATPERAHIVTAAPTPIG